MLKTDVILKSVEGDNETLESEDGKVKAKLKSERGKGKVKIIISPSK